MKEAFCRTCGSKTVARNTGKFDPSTGKEITQLVCSVDPCGHSGHNLTLIKHDTLLKRLFYIHRWVCTECGEKFS